MVPNGWEQKSLNEVVFINPRKPAKPMDSRVSFIPMDAVSEDARLLRLEERQYECVEKGFTSFKDNDVLVAKITPCFENGKGAIVSGLKNGIGFGSTEFHVLRAKSNICSKFIYYVTITQEFRIRGEMNMQGSAGQKRVTTDYLKALKVLLPPLPEQKKIAQILSTWDKAITTTEKLLTNSEQQKKALMQQLLTRKKRFHKFNKEWIDVHLSDISNIVMGTSPSSRSYNEKNLGLPLIQGNADILNRKSSPRIFTSEITKECTVGDILLSVRAPVGTVAISQHRACIGRGIASIKAKKDFNQEFLYQWFLWFEPKWGSLSQGSTFESISSGDIKSLKLLIPDLEEQQKIAVVLSTIDREIENVKQKLNCLIQEKKALMQQLLTGKKRVKVTEINNA
ncbi:TPA: restriction endonuclease subunit S [Legionella pneumophila]